MDLAEPQLHLTLAFSMLRQSHTQCTAAGIHSCSTADCIKLQRAAGYEFIAPFHCCVGLRICTGFEPDSSGSGLLVVLFGVVFGFWVWFGADLIVRLILRAPPSEFVSVTCAFRHSAHTRTKKHWAGKDSPWVRCRHVRTRCFASRWS